MSLSRPISSASPRRQFQFGHQRQSFKLVRQNTKLRGKTFIVAVDGSDQGVRCLKLTAAIMRPGEDSVKIITVDTGDHGTDSVVGHGGSPEGLLTASMNELVMRNIPEKAIETKCIKPSVASIPEAIVQETSALRRGVGVLVLGSFGVGAQKRSQDKGKGLGNVSQYVLLNARCPVALVKDGNIYGEVHQSIRPSLKLCCCVDGTGVSAHPPTHPRQPIFPACLLDRALTNPCAHPLQNSSLGTFDAALRFTRTGDSLSVLHVTASGNSEKEASISNYWDAETGKALATRGVRANAMCVSNTGKDVVDTLVKNSHGCDVRATAPGASHWPVTARG